MAIRDEILEEILKEYKNLEDLIGKDGILKDLTKRLIEKAMDSELTHRQTQRGFSFIKSPVGYRGGSIKTGRCSRWLIHSTQCSLSPYLSRPCHRVSFPQALRSFSCVRLLSEFKG